MFKSIQFFLQTLFISYIISVGFDSPAIAQEKIEFKIAGHNYTIPDFKEDSVVNFDNSFVNLGAITSIKQSKAPLEIRLYSWRKWGRPFDNVFIIQCTSKNVTLISTSILRKSINDKTEMSNASWELLKTENNFNYYKSVNEFEALISTDALIDTLINSDFFALKDEMQLIYYLTSTGKVIYDPCSVGGRRIMDCDSNDLLLVEIKADNKLRHFRIKSMDYDKANQTISSFVPYSHIKHFIYTLKYTHK